MLQVKISTPVILLFFNSTEIRTITKTYFKKTEKSLPTHNFSDYFFRHFQNMRSPTGHMTPDVEAIMAHAVTSNNQILNCHIHLLYTPT